MYQERIQAEQLWELSDPTVATYRAGTTTDGMLFAPGSYMPEGILPQDLDRARDGGFANVYPAPARGGAKNDAATRTI